METYRITLSEYRKVNTLGACVCHPLNYVNIWYCGKIVYCFSILCTTSIKYVVILGHLTFCFHRFLFSLFKIYRLSIYFCMWLLLSMSLLLFTKLGEFWMRRGLKLMNWDGKQLNKFFVNISCLWLQLECIVSSYNGKFIVQSLYLHSWTKDIFLSLYLHSWKMDFFHTRWLGLAGGVEGILLQIIDNPTLHFSMKLTDPELYSVISIFPFWRLESCCW